jgi:hypothetical protein
MKKIEGKKIKGKINKEVKCEGEFVRCVRSLSLVNILTHKIWFTSGESGGRERRIKIAQSVQLLSYGQNDRGIRVWFLKWAEIILSFIMPSPAPRPAQSPVLFPPGEKAAGAWSWLINSISAKINNVWSCTSSLSYVFMSWRYLSEGRRRGE